MAEPDHSPAPLVNLSNCDDEPIQIPGAIQPHGLLFALDISDMTIGHVSENCSDLLECPAPELIGRSIYDLFDQASAERLAQACMNPIAHTANPLRLVCVRKQRSFDGIVHRTRDWLILELEPNDSDDTVRFADFYNVVQHAVVRLQTTSTVPDLAQVAASEIRRLTGFDRVMVYRFDRDWHGEVIAEAKRTDLESFLGLHYPASDIPVQARRLYTLNWVRLIVDVNYRPAALLPPAGPASPHPIDLSHAVLRSVSPIHCEYLRNMGVSASMSLSLIKDGTQLWGLVACHHDTPKIIPYEVRMAADFLARTLSWQASTLERNERLEQSSKADRCKSVLLGLASTASTPESDPGFAASLPFTDALLANSGLLRELAGADGAALVFNGRIHLVGETPPLSAVQALVDWLVTRPNGANLVTDQLSAQYAPAVKYLATASGLLAVGLAPGTKDCLLWFRAEAVHTVNWAGKPNKSENTPAIDAPRLSPRGSFALWQETVKGHSLPWEDWHIAAATGLVDGLRENVLKHAAQITRLNAELRAAASTKDEFLATMSHELRTPLNAILGWLDLLESGDLTDPEEQVMALATISRNARAQQRLIEDLLDISRIISGKMRLDVEQISPHAAVSAAIDAVRPTADAKSLRIQSVLDPYAGLISGDPQRIQQIVWNLLVNAVKFTPKGGRVQVRLQRVDSSVEIVVADNGEGIEPEFLPHVFERFRQAEGSTARKHQGMGLGLAIVRQLVELHGGTVVAESQGQGHGAVFRIRLPIASVRSEEVKPAPLLPAVAHGIATGALPHLEGLRVLIVDDEPDARGFIERLLRKCKAETVTAGSGAEALAIFSQQSFDLLISDVGMPEMDGYAFISRVRALPADAGGRIPALALTAYARSSDRTHALFAGFQQHMSKPIAQSELLAVVASLVGRNIPN